MQSSSVYALSQEETDALNRSFEEDGSFSAKSKSNSLIDDKMREEMEIEQRLGAESGWGLPLPGKHPFSPL